MQVVVIKSLIYYLNTASPKKSQFNVQIKSNLLLKLSLNYAIFSFSHIYD